MVALIAESPAPYNPPPHKGNKGRVGNIPERLLARLWQQRAARQREFRTGGGRRVRVLYPGRASAAAGPDFRDALLEVEGLGLVRGDVELHLRQQDWYAHGHADDPNYNGVVLHAALETSPQVTHLQSGGRVPVISLDSLLDSLPDAAAAPAGAPAFCPGAGEAGAGGELWAILERQGWPRPGDAAGLGELLDAAGDARFRARSAVFHAFMQEQPAAQTLYEGIMEALGYRANRQPFLKLAHRAPWAALRREVSALPAAGRVEAIESRLLKLSGLPAAGSPGVPGGPPGSGFGYGSPMAAGEWHCFRVRPANHPRHRIAGAARLFARYIAAAPAAAEPAATDLLEGLAQAVAAGSPGRLTAALTVGADPGQRTAYIGAARAKDIAVNVVLPCLPAWAPLEAAGPALRLYHRFGKLQDNELTREMAALLLAPEPGWAGVVTTARRQQGLIHLRRQLAGG